MKDIEAIKSALRTFLESIEIKSIKLKEIRFKVLETSVDNQEIEMEISLTNKVLRKTQEEISILYTFKDNSKLKSENIQILISYELILRLKNPIDVKREVLKAYADNSGLLLIYPYVRHQVDMLKRETGYILPPLPHVLLRL